MKVVMGFRFVQILVHDYGTIVRMGETCGVENGPVIIVFCQVSWTLSFSCERELVFFIQFRICLLTVRSNLTSHNGILRETLITLLGIFGSRSLSVRHVTTPSF